MSARKKKLYLCVIGAGAIALAADRLFLSRGPALVSAANDELQGEPGAAAAASSPVLTAAAESASSSGNNLIPEIPFPRGVKTGSNGPPLRDFFRPPFRDQPARGNLDQRAQQEPLAPSREGFADRHRLQVVLTRDGFRVAVIDGAWMRPGDTLDGCVLQEIRGTQAIFACADGEAALTITGDKSTTGR